MNNTDVAKSLPKHLLIFEKPSIYAVFSRFVHHSHSNITFVLTVNLGLNGAFSCCFSTIFPPIPLIQQRKCCQKVLSVLSELFYYSKAIVSSAFGVLNYIIFSLKNQVKTKNSTLKSAVILYIFCQIDYFSFLLYGIFIRYACTTFWLIVS